MDNLYLLSGNGYMINKNIKMLRDKIGIQLEELNVTAFRDMPAVSELVDVCSNVPLMSDKRLVILKDAQVLSPKAGKEDSKKLAEYLQKLPATSVLIMCYEGDPDRRRALYKYIKKQGTVYEYPEPKDIDCINFTMQYARKNGASIDRQAAALLVGIAGCDYYAVENEMEKLIVYSGGREILKKHIKECASKSLEYNVFEVHSLLAGKKAEEALTLLDEILIDGRPEALIGLIAYNFREMYKVRSMMDLSYPAGKIAQVLNSRDFIIRKRMGECGRFSGEEIREGLRELGELDFSIKSGRSDAVLKLSQTLLKIYKL